MSVEEVAMGFVKVANENMCRPIRALTQAKGYDTSHHVLACFGGAGGQHACAVARSLGMSTVYVHKYVCLKFPLGPVSVLLINRLARNVDDFDRGIIH